MEKMTLPIAIKKHLSLPGEGVAEIRNEYVKLNDKDKAYFTKAFRDEGIEIVSKMGK